jgi:hypothetical protein
MQTVGLAAFISGAGLYIALPFHLHRGTPLHPRTSVNNVGRTAMARRHREHLMARISPLYLCSKSTKCVAVALQELVGERAPNVLPALESLILIKYLLGPDEELIGPFVAARRLLGHPVTVSHWHAE